MVVRPSPSTARARVASEPRPPGLISRDPLPGVNGTTTVANPYHYTDNDPLNKTDPLGLRPDDLVFNDPCFQGTGVPGLTQRGNTCGTLESPEAKGLFCSWQNPSNALNRLAAQNPADFAIREAGVRFGTSGGREGGAVPYPGGGP